MKRVLVGYAEPKAEEGDRERGKKKFYFQIFGVSSIQSSCFPKKGRSQKARQHNVSAVSILHNGTRGGINTSENT